MLVLRKFDCYGQLIVAFVFIASLLVIEEPNFFIGASIIGCWQLLSAAFNTKSFIHTGFQKRVSYYWIFSIADLLLLFLAYTTIEQMSKVLSDMLAGITLIAAIAIAVYYWHIYFKLIDLLSLRNELDGLTKSKH